MMGEPHVTSFVGLPAVLIDLPGSNVEKHNYVYTRNGVHIVKIDEK